MKLVLIIQHSSVTLCLFLVTGKIASKRYKPEFSFSPVVYLEIVICTIYETIKMKIAAL